MRLNDIYEIKVPRARRRRVGRGAGSGHGKTSGRGHKGAQARAGYSRTFGHEGGQMPLFRRLPKRGFSNARFRVEYSVVNLSDLRCFEAGSSVDLDVLKSKGMIPKNARLLKILGRGVLDRALKVKAHGFSAKAALAIKAAGGEAEEISA